jgi:hypothetical protein
MGGIQTLNIGLHNLGTFRYLAPDELWLDQRAPRWFRRVAEKLSFTRAADVGASLSQQIRELSSSADKPREDEAQFCRRSRDVHS